MRRHVNEWPLWPNARDWIGIGTFLLTVMILWMVKEDPRLRNDEFFKTIATLIIGTGFINGCVSWAYSATQGGQVLAEHNAAIVNKAAGVGDPAPQNAADAAEQTADAAVKKADDISKQADQ